MVWFVSTRVGVIVRGEVGTLLHNGATMCDRSVCGESRRIASIEVIQDVCVWFNVIVFQLQLEVWGGTGCWWDGNSYLLCMSGV